MTLYRGSTLVGGINFNKGNTQETLIFNGLANTNFNNLISGLNVINATNSSNVVMNSGSGYELVAAGKVLVDGTSILVISGVIHQDQALPTVAVSSIQKTGAGTLTLSGANTYSVGTSLNVDTIAVGNNSALGSGNSMVDTNSNNLSLSGNITGTGAVTKVGNGNSNSDG